MNMLFVPSLMLLLTLDVVTAVTSAKVVSFSKIEHRGSLMCAIDVPHKTISSSSSLKDCSLTCARRDICSGFNIKDSLTCVVYNDEPSLFAPVPGCTFYKVSKIDVCRSVVLLYM